MGLAIVFEHGDFDQPAFAKALWATHEREVEFRNNRSKMSVPFAACDWLAWECRHWMTNRERALVALEKAKSYVHPEINRLERLKSAQLLMADTAVMTEVGRRMPAHALTYGNWDALKRMAERKGWPRTRQRIDPTRGSC